MKDNVQKRLDELFSDEKPDRKRSTSKLSSKSTFAVMAVTAAIAVGGIGTMAGYQSYQAQQEQQGLVESTSRESGPSSGSSESRGGSTPEAFQKSYSERTLARSCDGQDVAVPLSWSGDRKPSESSMAVMRSIIDAVDDTASRDEIIALVAKSMALSRLTNPVNTMIDYPSSVSSVGSVTSSDMRSGTFMTVTTDQNWKQVMDIESASREQLQLLRDQGADKYMESITPSATSSSGFVNAAARLVSEYGAPESAGTVDCIDTTKGSVENAYQAVTPWIGRAASPGSGSDIVGPTLSRSRGTGPPSFGGLQLVRYAVRQGVGETLPKSIDAIMAKPTTRNKEGAIAIAMDSGKPVMVGVSSGSGEVVIADERSGVIRSLPIRQFGEMVEYR